MLLRHGEVLSGRLTGRSKLSYRFVGKPVRRLEIWHKGERDIKKFLVQKRCRPHAAIASTTLGYLASCRSTYVFSWSLSGGPSEGE